MLSLQVKSTESGLACGTDMQVTARQDLGCLSRPKYIYHFHRPIPAAIVEGFAGCDKKIISFSKHVLHARDLLKVSKKGVFQADVIISGFSAVVYFTGRVDRPPAQFSEPFDQCLYDAGYGLVTYLSVQKPPCGQCPMQYLKNCMVV